MKKSITVFAVLALSFLTQTSHASMCLSGQLPAAQKNVLDIKARAQAGLASDGDVLLAEKYVLEIKLCENFSDLDAYGSLVQNTISRLSRVQAAANAGVVSSDEVIFVRNEMDGQKKTCAALAAIYKARADAGVAPSTDVSIIKGICALIK